MAQTVTFNGSNYSIPDVGNRQWGQNVTNYLLAIASGALQKSGGNFTLTADVNFGANFGLVSTYFKSRSSNLATTGVIRFANNEGSAWRNAANSADKVLKVNASDQLEFDGTALPTASDLANKQPLDATLTALAAYNTNGLITQTSADTFTGRTLTAGTGISVTNGDGVSGNPTVAVSTVPIANGGTGQTSKTAAYDALSPNTTKGDIEAHNGTNNVRLAVGSNGQVLTADSAETTGLKWTSPLTNPMADVGDLIRGGTSGATTRLAGNTNAEPAYLSQTGTGSASAAPVWKRPSQLGQIRLHTGNGYGSTNNKIRRFTTIVSNTITGLTYADSATLGASFTCTEAGTYCFSYGDGLNAVAAIGLSLNSSQLTTTVVSITTADRLIYVTTGGAANFSAMTVTLQLAVGDVVRPHTDGSGESASPSRVHMNVTRIL